ncbi:MAG: ABC transporter ATP-binding protein [Pseudomonadota bacterium]
MSARNPSSTFALLMRLWRDYLSAYKGRLLLALAAMALYAAAYSVIPVGLEWINSAFANGSNRFAATPRDVVVFGPLLVIALGVVTAAAQYAQARFSIGAALSALRDMQRDMYARLVALDMTQLRAEASGQMISRFTNDPMVLRETLTRAARAVADLLTLIGLCAVMIYYDIVLFVIVLIVYGIIGWPVAAIGKYLRQRSREAQEQAGEIAAMVNETVAAAATIKTYGLEERQKSRAEDAFNTRLSLLKKLSYLRALNEPVVFAIGAGALGVVVGVVAWRVMSGALNGPQFVSFVVALFMLSQPARGLSTLNAVAQEGLAAFERMLAVIDAAPEAPDQPGAKPLIVDRGAVSFRGVGFSYGEGAAALNDVSLDAPAGATVALVGASGAGKSTLFSLLTRLYEPDGGAISIDGQDISSVTRSSLRNAIAYVGQDAFLFDASIGDNIRVGVSGDDAGETVDDALLIAAAKAAAAHEFIMATPQHYQTPVGEGGARLSGGQRQRIALARAFLKDAPILLLDEATAALDADSEAAIKDALARICKGRTTLIIAHRLSTVQNADLIAVMDKGRIVASGAHEALMATNEAYARFAELQLVRHKRDERAAE